jgi:hypothetical protein
MPSVQMQQRVMRIEMDALKLMDLSRAEIKTIYDKIEQARDALSRVLDRADGKHA